MLWDLFHKIIMAAHTVPPALNKDTPIWLDTDVVVKRSSINNSNIKYYTIKDGKSRPNGKKPSVHIIATSGIFPQSSWTLLFCNSCYWAADPFWKDITPYSLLTYLHSWINNFLNSFLISIFVHRNFNTWYLRTSCNTCNNGTQSWFWGTRR